VRIQTEIAVVIGGSVGANILGFGGGDRPQLPASDGVLFKNGVRTAGRARQGGKYSRVTPSPIRLAGLAASALVQFIGVPGTRAMRQFLNDGRLLANHRSFQLNKRPPNMGSHGASELLNQLIA
jgi:hypothetical protein